MNSLIFKSFMLVWLLFGATILRGQDVADQPDPNIIRPTATNNNEPEHPFRKNLGQWPDDIRFEAIASGTHVRFMDSGISYGLVKMQAPERTETPGLSKQNIDISALVWNKQFLGVNEECSMNAENPKPSRVNYYRGADESKWARNVPEYTEVKYHNLYDGIDLNYYVEDGSIKYDFVAAPYADPTLIQFEFEGIESLNLLQDGSLEIKHAWGSYREAAPYSYQLVDNERREIPVRFVTEGASVRFEVLGQYNRSLPLVIDPFELRYCTYVNCTNLSATQDIAIRNAAEPVSVGFSYVGLETTSGAFQELNAGNLDAFVLRTNSTGDALVYSTYIGGAGRDFARGVAITSVGNAVVTGETESSDFPTTGIATTDGGSNLFVAEIDNTGGLVYSRTYGGTSNQFDGGQKVVLDLAGDIYITGSTQSSGFPVSAGAFQTTHGGGSDALMLHLDAAGNFLAGTFLGGSGFDAGLDIDFDGAGAVYVVGVTNSPNLPVGATPPFQPMLAGATDGFISRMDPAAATLNYCSYYGGAADDRINAIDHNSPNDVYVAGTSFQGAPDLPVSATALQSVRPGGISSDGFVANWDCYAAGAGGLIAATFFGGTDADEATGIVVNDLDQCFVSGMTYSDDLDTEPLEPQEDIAPSFNHRGDIFVTGLTGDLSMHPNCVSTTYYGGTEEEGREAGWQHTARIALLDGAGRSELTIGFSTWSGDLPTTAGSWTPVPPAGTGVHGVPAILHLWADKDCAMSDCNTFFTGITDINTTVCAGECAMVAAEYETDCLFLPEEGSFSWTADGAIIPDVGAEVTPVFCFDAPGSYTVTLNVSVAPGIHFPLHSTTITVLDAPDPDLGPDQVLCAGQTIVLDASSATPTLAYAWSTGETTSSINVSAPGVYSVTATGDNGCARSDAIEIVDAAALSLSNFTICAGESVQLDAGMGVSYTWSPATGLDDPNAQMPVASPSATTTYTVTIDHFDGCTTSATCTVTVMPLPTVSIDPVRNDRCLFTPPVAMSALPPGGVWNEHVISVAGSVVFDPAFVGVGLHEVTYTYTDPVTGCSNVASTDMNVLEAPFVDAGADIVICPEGFATLGESPTASGATAPYTYSWSGAVWLNDPTVANPVATPIMDTDFSVSVTDANGCVATDLIHVDLDSGAMDFDLGGPIVVCDGSCINVSAPFDENDPCLQFEWFRYYYTTNYDKKGNPVSTVTYVPYHQGHSFCVSATDDMQFLLMVTNNCTGCKATDDIEIQVISASDPNCGTVYQDDLCCENNNGNKRAEAELLSDEIEVSVYPVPANETVTLTVANGGLDQMPVLLDAMGQRVINRCAKVGPAGWQFDVHHLASGTYFIRMVSQGKTLHKRVVVTH